MKIVLRVDASVKIGFGHVMRCLALADALKSRGVACEFICRKHPGNLIEFISKKGYKTHIIPMGFNKDINLSHSDWLGASQLEDIQICAKILLTIQPDWLIVDHYALDITWEYELSHCYRHLMVIDDLADRRHKCQILLDQTHGRSQADYDTLIANGCNLLYGSDYALLRPEFAVLREYSLQRRKNFNLKRLLIALGGVDKDNITSKILRSIRNFPLPSDCEILIVLGSAAPWIDDVRELARSMPWRSTVCVDVPDMAKLMADSDLAIGAAGTSAWERCCLGLPTFLVILADNQRDIARGLVDAGAAILFDDIDTSTANASLDKFIASTNVKLLGKIASSISDGLGTMRVVDFLIRGVKNAN